MWARPRETTRDLAGETLGTPMPSLGPGVAIGVGRGVGPPLEASALNRGKNHNPPSLCCPAEDPGGWTPT